MHIDPACKEPSKKADPLLEEPGNELHQEQEDDMSLIKTVPVSRGQGVAWGKAPQPGKLT